LRKRGIGEKGEDKHTHTERETERGGGGRKRGEK